MDQRKCEACEETEPSTFIHTVSKDGVFRRLCTDCLLKEHREHFCPICLDVFVYTPCPDSGIVCLRCPSIIHPYCSPPPPSPGEASSSSAAAPGFTCPPCSDPKFSFFPKSRPDDAETLLDVESSKALVAAARISVVCMERAADKLKREAVKKIMEAKNAKMRAKEALGNLQDIVVRQNALKRNNSHH